MPVSKRWPAVVLGFGAVVGTACTTKAEPTVDESTQRVALYAKEDSGEVTVLFSQSQDNDQLQEVLEGNTPRGFHWVTITVPASREQEIYSAAGLRADLRNAEQSIVFKQMYFGPCNPATEDFNGCWLFEHVSAGEEGADGSIELRIVDGNIVGGWDVIIERLTDKFGPPTQPHRYQTTSAVNIPLVPVNSR